MKTLLKVRILFLMAVFGPVFVLSGCGNRRISLGLGQKLSYNSASVYSPDEKVIHSGALNSWRDYENATVAL